MTTTQELPHSTEAETYVIAYVLFDGVTALVKALDAKVTEDCFSDPRNLKLWRAILWNNNHGRPLDANVIIDELRKANKLDAIGVDHILAIISLNPTHNTFAHWLEQLVELYVLRELVKAADNVKTTALTYKGNVEDFVSITSKILSVRHGSQKQQTLSEAAVDAYSLCERIMKGESTDVDHGLPFPWPDWNKRFGHAQGGELIVVAARPGRGKSSAVRQIAWHWSNKLKGNVILFSREMPICGLPQLFAQTLSGHSWRDFKRNQLGHKQSLEFMDALKAVMAEKNLHISDKDRTLSQVTARIKSFGHMMPIKGIVVDYLQRYDPQQERGETRDIAIGRMTMALKDAAIELKIPVILLAQISRGVERDGREPMLSDLRESGNIEQDADRVIFLDAPQTLPDGTNQDLNDGDKKRIFINAIQAKGRGEGCDRVGMMFNRPITAFESTINI